VLPIRKAGKLIVTNGGLTRRCPFRKVGHSRPSPASRWQISDSMRDRVEKSTKNPRALSLKCVNQILFRLPIFGCNALGCHEDGTVGEVRAATVMPFSAIGFSACIIFCSAFV
jgi:hypothetical protein